MMQLQPPFISILVSQKSEIVDIWSRALDANTKFRWGS